MSDFFRWIRENPDYVVLVFGWAVVYGLIVFALTLAAQAIR